MACIWFIFAIFCLYQTKVWGTSKRGFYTLFDVITNILRKCMEICVENLYVDIRPQE